MVRPRFFVQGGPFNQEKDFVDIEISSCALVLEVYTMAELWILCQQTVFRDQMDHPVVWFSRPYNLSTGKMSLRSRPCGAGSWPSCSCTRRCLWRGPSSRSTWRGWRGQWSSSSCRRTSGWTRDITYFQKNTPASSQKSKYPKMFWYHQEESLNLGNVWVFVQLIHRPTRTKNQLYKNQKKS